MDTLSFLSLGRPCLFLRPPLTPLPSFPASLLPPSRAAQTRGGSSGSLGPGRLRVIVGLPHSPPEFLSLLPSLSLSLSLSAGSHHTARDEEGEVREEGAKSSLALPYIILGPLGI